jgi:hypothetical protein
MIGELLAALWQGGLIFFGLLILLAGGYLLVYWSSWGSAPHWFEGFRDRFKLRYLLDNRFWPWIHQDTQYWVVRLRFDRGPVIVEGRPTDCRYWSISYYPAKEHNFSIDTKSVRLDAEGKYRITLGKDVEDSEPNQTIQIDSDVKRGIIELRITLPHVEKPVVLPSVYQNEVRLVEGEEV